MNSENLLKVRELYNKLIQLDSYEPNNYVNTLFSELVNYALKGDYSAHFTKDELLQLNIMCSKAEFELERHWANKILHSKSPNLEVMKFPYWKNYIELTKVEWNSFIGCHDHKDHEVLFIGGGPLPLTAIVLATIHKVRSTIVEVDQDAVELSRDLIRVLGLSDMIKIEHSSAEEFGRYSKYNTIFIAALAGLEPENKIKILEKIKSESAGGSHILARSSYGGRTLLYMPLSDQVSKLFKPILEVRPLNDIVNSVLIFQN